MTLHFKGLTAEEVKRSAILHGNNVLQKEKTKGFFGKFIDNLSDPIIRILIIAVSIEFILTLGNTNYAEIIGIISAITISTLVSTVSEYKSEQAFIKMEKEMHENDVSVMRDGSLKKIDANELVVGDIVYISAGEKVQADGKLINGSICVDQSALNGESIETQKYTGDYTPDDLHSPSAIFRGSLI